MFGRLARLIGNSLSLLLSLPIIMLILLMLALFYGAGALDRAVSALGSIRRR